MHKIDLSSDPEGYAYRLLKQDICARLRERSKSNLAGFINEFEKLLRIQHLFISRIISLHINQEAAKVKKTPVTSGVYDYAEKAKKLYASVTKLVATATQKNTVRNLIGWALIS